MKAYVPVPKATAKKGGDSTETTLCILEIIKERTIKESKAKKVRSLNYIKKEVTISGGYDSSDGHGDEEKEAAKVVTMHFAELA